MALLELQNVDKFYGSFKAISGINLSLNPGRIALLGPNGAGKSTLLKLILGLLSPDAGTITVLERNVRSDGFAVRSQLGYMSEGDGLLPELSALDYTRLAAELAGLPRAEATARAHQVLHYVGLGEARYRLLQGFSTGMRQRARLAQALVGDPKLVLLDEPTSGLDPQGRDEMLALIRDIPDRTGASVILSTHILPDVEKTCEHVLVLSKGELLYDGALAPLIESDESVLEVRVKAGLSEFRRALEMERCVILRDDAATLVFRLPEGEDLHLVLQVAKSGGFQVRHLAPMVRSLETAFLETIESASQV